MHVEPVEIQHVKLGRRVLGYRRQTVDRLLEDVTASYEVTWHEREQLRTEVDELREEFGNRAYAEQLLKDVAVQTQRAADETLRAARDEATALLEDARRKAFETVRSAEGERERLKSEVRRLESAEQEVGERFRSLIAAASDLIEGRLQLRNGSAGAPKPAPSPPPQSEDGDVPSSVPGEAVAPTVTSAELATA